MQNRHFERRLFTSRDSASLILRTSCEIKERTKVLVCSPYRDVYSLAMEPMGAHVKLSVCLALLRS